MAVVYNQAYRRGSTFASGASGTAAIAEGLPGVTHRRIDTALAGFVLLSIFNTLLLAVLGTAPTVTNTTYSNREVASTRGAQMTNTQPTAAYPTATAAHPTTTSAYPTTAATPAQGGVIGAGQTVV